MKLPEAKIELAASDEASRYTLQAVKLDVEHKRIMATDGHILAIVPCEVSPDDHSALLSLGPWEFPECGCCASHRRKVRRRMHGFSEHRFTDETGKGINTGSQQGQTANRATLG